jgi:hypothetical protein
MPADEESYSPRREDDALIYAHPAPQLRRTEASLSSADLIRGPSAGPAAAAGGVGSPKFGPPLVPLSESARRRYGRKALARCSGAASTTPGRTPSSHCIADSRAAPYRPCRWRISFPSWTVSSRPSRHTQPRPRHRRASASCRGASISHRHQRPADTTTTWIACQHVTPQALEPAT